MERAVGAASRPAIGNAAPAMALAAAPSRRPALAVAVGEDAGATIDVGDVAAGIQAALPESGVDALMGIGGTPEGVLTAAAIRCIGGAIQAKPWPRNDEERKAAQAAGLDLDRVFTTEEMVGGEDVFFAATGASAGELLRGVRFFGGGAETQSLVMRSRSGSIRWIDSLHDFTRLNKIRYRE